LMAESGMRMFPFRSPAKNCCAIFLWGRATNGAGTTAAGLAAGRPTLICPLGADQHMWAAIAHRELGVGPPPVALARLTPALLAARLRALVTDAGFRARAAALAAEIAKDDGLARAVEVVEAGAAVFEGWGGSGSAGGGGAAADLSEGDGLARLQVQFGGV
jgi:hypothetical protein